MPKNDENDFALNITQLVGDDDLRHRLAREARSYARDWQSDAIAGKLINLYQGVVDRRASACAAVQPA